MLTTASSLNHNNSTVEARSTSMHRAANALFFHWLRENSPSDQAELPWVSFELFPFLVRPPAKLGLKGNSHQKVQTPNFYYGARKKHQELMIKFDTQRLWFHLCLDKTALVVLNKSINPSLLHISIRKVRKSILL